MCSSIRVPNFVAICCLLAEIFSSYVPWYLVLEPKSNTMGDLALWTTRWHRSALHKAPSRRVVGYWNNSAYIETACVVRLAYPPLVVAATRIYTAAHHSVITHIRRHHIFNVQHHPSALALSRKLVKIQHLPRRAHVAILVLEGACGVPLRCATLHTTHAQG